MPFAIAKNGLPQNAQQPVVKLLQTIVHRFIRLANKMRRVDETGATVILTANPGCLLQLRAGVAESKDGGRARRVMHVLEFLDEGYG